MPFSLDASPVNLQHVTDLTACTSSKCWFVTQVNARLFIPAAMSGTGNDYVLEQRAGITFEIGSGGVLPELEQCVLKLKVNGTAKCR